MNSPTLLGVRINKLNPAAVLETVKSYLGSNQFHHLATVNPEFLVEAQHNEAFKSLLNQTDLNVCDGFGITFWTKILYNKKIPRFTGVELAEAICSLAAKEQKSVYFLGGFGVAKKAAEKMGIAYPTLPIAGFEDGDPAVISPEIKTANPDILLVAFGAPAQEFWIQKFHHELPNLKMAVGVGGTFDFWANKAHRAPKLLRRMGLEWLWRLLTEPRKRAIRIWKAVVVFSVLVLKERFGK